MQTFDDFLSTIDVKQHQLKLKEILRIGITDVFHHLSDEIELRGW